MQRIASNSVANRTVGNVSVPHEPNRLTADSPVHRTEAFVEDWPHPSTELRMLGSPVIASDAGSEGLRVPYRRGSDGGRCARNLT